MKKKENVTQRAEKLNSIRTPQRMVDAQKVRFPDDAPWKDIVSLLESIDNQSIMEKRARDKKIEQRQQLVDLLRKYDAIPQDSPVNTVLDIYGYKVCIRIDMDYDVSVEKLYKIAEDNNCESVLSEYFSWRPSVVRSKWKAADASIHELFKPAVLSRLCTQRIDIVYWTDDEDILLHATNDIIKNAAEYRDMKAKEPHHQESEDGWDDE